MPQTKAKSGKKGRKHGRNKDWCKLYAERGTRTRNKAKRLVREAKKQPNNTQVVEALKRLVKEEPMVTKISGVKALI